MYDVAPTHAIGLIAGLAALPIAIAYVRLSRAHRRRPGTVQIACALMLITGAIHLALIPHHLVTDPITALLFFGNGIGFIALAMAVRWRWWRFTSAAMLVTTVVAYLIFQAALPAGTFTVCTPSTLSPSRLVANTGPPYPSDRMLCSAVKPNLAG